MPARDACLPSAYLGFTSMEPGHDIRAQAHLRAGLLAVKILRTFMDTASGEPVHGES